MRKIAVFTTGDAPAAGRLVTLFNEGNRIKVDVLVTDGDPVALQQRLGEYGIEVIDVAPECSPEELTAVADTLASRDIELYAFENYEGQLSALVRERHPERTVELTTAEEAPREVVAALSALDRRKEEAGKGNAPEAPKTADEEWAETLQIDFDSKRAEEARQRVEEARERMAGMQTPPPVPGRQLPPATPKVSQPDFASNPQYIRPEANQSYGQQCQGYGNRPVNNEPMPPTYLVWSVIMTVLCCLLPGIVAIIFSSQVGTKYYAGDIEGAKRASRNAEIWIIVSFVLGVLSATLYMPIMMIS